MRANCLLLLWIVIHEFVSLVVEAPDPSCRRDARHRSGRSRPYDINDRGSNTACRDGREQRRGPTATRDGSQRRPLPPPTVQYPIPTFLANPSVLTSNPITLYVSHIEGVRIADTVTGPSSMSRDSVIGAARVAGGSESRRRWDNPNPPPRQVPNSENQSQPPQPVPPPAQQPTSSTSTRQQPPQRATSGQTTGNSQLPDLSTPPPPLWQPYLRDLVITLGYREAINAWPQLTRCTSGNFTSEDRIMQEVYMEWCRQTLIGFER